MGTVLNLGVVEWEYVNMEYGNELFIVSKMNRQKKTGENRYDSMGMEVWEREYVDMNYGNR